MWIPKIWISHFGQIDICFIPSQNSWIGFCENVSELWKLLIWDFLSNNCSQIFTFQMQAHEPDLWLHFMSHEIQPLRLVFRWMMRGFSGHLPPEQLLYLWDLVIAHDSMEVNLHVKRLILNAFSKLLLHRFLQSCYNVSAIFSHPC